MLSIFARFAILAASLHCVQAWNPLAFDRGTLGGYCVLPEQFDGEARVCNDGSKCRVVGRPGTYLCLTPPVPDDETSCAALSSTEAHPIVPGFWKAGQYQDCQDHAYVSLSSSAVKFIDIMLIFDSLFACFFASRPRWF